ncbi:MAG: hypothetical protein ACRDDH_06120 [Cetobacterium sp.]|uniref:hypothetical protein n=2 Tax=Cetobacterium sp. TaxID=2071632 RepID=UPI003EE7B502
MKMNKDVMEKVKELAKFFSEMESSVFFEDEESEQTEKIFKIFNNLQKESPEEKKGIYDSLIDEVMELKMISAIKYIKIGIAYTQSRGGF